MEKIEELIDSIIGKDKYSEQYYSRKDIAHIMKEYAEWYALMCLDKIMDESYYDDYLEHLLNCKVINNFKLPNHENI